MFCQTIFCLLGCPLLGPLAKKRQLCFFVSALMDSSGFVQLLQFQVWNIRDKAGGGGGDRNSRSCHSLSFKVSSLSAFFCPTFVFLCLFYNLRSFYLWLPGGGGARARPPSSPLSYVLSRSVVSDSLWAPVDCSPQASLSMGFSRQGYWSGLSSPSPRNLPYPKMEPSCLMYLALVGGFFTTSATWEASKSHSFIYLFFLI